MTALYGNLRDFAHQHDDLPAFHAAYLVMTLLTAALCNLGVFAVLIVCHMALDFVKYHSIHGLSIGVTIRGVIKESLIDVTLFAIALVFVVYFDHNAGLVSLSGLLRAEMTIVYAIGVVIPKMNILHRALSAMMHLRHYISQVSDVRGPFGLSEKIQLFFLVLSIGIIAAAPAVLHIGADHMLLILREEMIPGLV